MKCVVGIDIERHSDSAIALLGRLQFSIEESQLLHVTEIMQVTLPYSAYGVFVETDAIHETLEQLAKDAVEAACKVAQACDLHPKAELCEGYALQSLLDTADESGASLIAVTSTARSTIGAIFGGSIARGLAISAKQSILVARQEATTDGPLRAVFATDQSAYCAECLKLLVEFAPKGISHLTLLTVHEREKHEGILSRFHSVDAKSALEDADRSLEEKGQTTAQWLSDQGIPTESKIVAGSVEESIHEVMEEMQADLLIVGSQGHGFMERVMVGSTALHEVIGEKYPVLLLRPRLQEGI